MALNADTVIRDLRKNSRTSMKLFKDSALVQDASIVILKPHKTFRTLMNYAKVCAEGIDV